MSAAPAVPRPASRRPWALGFGGARGFGGALGLDSASGLGGLAVTREPAESLEHGMRTTEEAVLAFVRERVARPVPSRVPASGVSNAALLPAPARLSWAAPRRRIAVAVRRGVSPLGRRWRRAEQAEGRRVAETVFSVTIGVLAVLLTLVVVSALLPGVALVGGVAIGFLPLTGGLAGYASWRWARWVRDRADRLHWSVLATAGAAVTAAELYGAAAIVASRTGFLERVAAFGGLGLLTATTIAVTGVASLITYHRSVTDAQLTVQAHRFA